MTDDSNSSMSDITPNTSPIKTTKKHHTRRGSRSKIISIHSTVDGDIQTVVEDENDENGSEEEEGGGGQQHDESLRGFMHHLRESWEDSNSTTTRSTLNNEGAGCNNDDNAREEDVGGMAVPRGTTTAATKKSHLSRAHKQRSQNLSVQFFENFSISGDNVNTTEMDEQRGDEGGTNSSGANKRNVKETIERTASYYFDTPTPTKQSGDEESKCTTTEGDAAAATTSAPTALDTIVHVDAFHQLLRQQSDSENREQELSGPGHKKSQSVLFCESTI